MCFHVKVTKSKAQIEAKTKLKFNSEISLMPNGDFNAFDHPKLAVITEAQNDLQFFSWGLLPKWANDDFNTNNTLNARIETLAEKPSFRDSLHNRCVILVDGFYEWRMEGKNKVKYELSYKNELMYLAALYAEKTFAIVTTQATGIMTYIHNTKQRMPLTFNENENMKRWLLGEEFEPFYDFDYRRKDGQIGLFS